MDVVLPTSGSYVIAVSGGVDSMALLHALHHNNQGKEWKLTVAHLDHGIREDSSKDRELVQNTASQLGLPFVYHEISLGPGASEAEARNERYKFLNNVRQVTGARAIVTAHHQDDLLETAILNIVRGSGRKGLTSLSSRHDMVRPLLHLSKNQLIEYAKDQGLNWHEDSTNNNLDYLRNYIRHRIVPRLDYEGREKLLAIINDLRETNEELDTLLVNQLHLQSHAGKLDRIWFNQLPHAVAKETLATWLRANDTRDFDTKMLEKLVIVAKVADAGKQFDVLRGVKLIVSSDYLALDRLER